MVATRDLKYAAGVGEHAFFHVLDPSPVHAYRHLVLGFARHGAGVTSDALAVIDYEAVFHALEVRPEKCRSIILGSGRNGSDGGEAACYIFHKLSSLASHRMTKLVLLNLVIDIVDDPLQRF